MSRLIDFRVLTFDCYGVLQPLIMRNADAGVTRDAALRAFARCESRQQRTTPGLRYPTLLAHQPVVESPRRTESGEAPG